MKKVIFLFVMLFSAIFFVGNDIKKLDSAENAKLKTIDTIVIKSDSAKNVIVSEINLLDSEIVNSEALKALSAASKAISDIDTALINKMPISDSAKTDLKKKIEWAKSANTEIVGAATNLQEAIKSDNESFINYILTIIIALVSLFSILAKTIRAIPSIFDGFAQIHKLTAYVAKLFNGKGTISKDSEGNKCTVIHDVKVPEGCEIKIVQKGGPDNIPEKK